MIVLGVLRSELQRVRVSCEGRIVNKRSPQVIYSTKAYSFCSFSNSYINGSESSPNVRSIVISQVSGLVNDMLFTPSNVLYFIILIELYQEFPRVSRPDVQNAIKPS